MNKKSLIINKDFDPIILGTVLKRYWWWPVLFVLLFSTLAYFFLRYTKPVYESTMMIQLDNEDNAAEVLSVKNINIKEDISSDIELMRSQLMFEKAIQRINYNVSVFSKGSVLTEEKFNSSELSILPYALKDSSLIGVQMFIQFDGKFVLLSYNHNGRAHRLKGLLNEHIQNKHFDIVVKSSNPLELKEDSEENELYFIFNSIESFASRYLSSLQVVPIDPVAKTIQITFRGNNAQMCHDIALAVAEEYIEYTDEEKQRGRKIFFCLSISNLTPWLESSGIQRTV